MTLDEGLVKRQLELEEYSVQEGVRKYKEILYKAKNEADLPPGMHLMKRSLEPYINAIKLFLVSKGSGSYKFGSTKTFISTLPVEDVAYISSKRIFSALSKDEPLQKISISIANMLHDHREILKYQKEAPGHYHVVKESIKGQDKKHERTVILFAKRKVGIADTPMTELEKFQVGRKLVEIFIQATGLVELFQSEPETLGKEGKYVLHGTEAVREWLESQHDKCSLLQPFLLPMISPPRPWTTIDDGGYYSTPLTLVKTRNKLALETLRNYPMPIVYRTLNALQDTPWRINKKIYDIIKTLWDSGSTLGGLPSQEEEPLPVKPWNTDKECEYLKATQPEVFQDWKKKAHKVHVKRVQDDSIRTSMVYKMVVAQKMIEEERFYYCYNLDWRGRVYPVQGHVNPQSDDIGKALIEFAEGKSLGEEGLFWLKVHLANTYSGSINVNEVKAKTDKSAFEERVKWVEDNEALILDCANNPLDGSRFWVEADCPFEFLAACFEYQGYKQEGLAFKNHISIALDGSCNGLQNFSAMLRDALGGKAVNLVPQDTPNDIYARVAERLVKKVERDASDKTGKMFPEKIKEGSKQVPLSYIAGLWVGKITRDICKRGVMTTPYGAKQYGMKDQLKDKLKKMDAKYLETEEDLNLACSYLGSLLYDTIGEVVIAAREAMDWLQNVAKIASKANKPIKWTTPAGFTPYQEYLETKRTQINTIFGGIRIRFGLAQDLPDKLDKRRQLNGISPNFVHSMDASHLMLTINKCLDAGITNFAMIHDSYGTYACDTGKLAELLREAFIEQYSEDVLENFRKEVMEQLGREVELPPVPKKGDLDLSLVRESRYFFA